jgi:anti-anti-sigma factor
MKTKILELKPSGKITLSNCDDIQEDFIGKIQRCDSDNVVLNLENTGFMDSRGISMIVKLNRVCKEKKVGFSIKGCKKRHFDLFKILKLDLIIPISEGL